MFSGTLIFITNTGTNEIIPLLKNNIMYMYDGMKFLVLNIITLFPYRQFAIPTIRLLFNTKLSFMITQ